MGRAEHDLEAFRSRGQAVLTISGGLVTVIGAILVFAVGAGSLKLTGLTSASAAGSVMAFFIATGLVLLMFRPSDAAGLDAGPLKQRINTQWDLPGWDQTVARREVDYLTSLRRISTRLAKLLRLAITFQVAGIFGVLVLVLTLLDQG